MRTYFVSCFQLLFSTVSRKRSQRHELDSILEALQVLCSQTDKLNADENPQVFETNCAISHRFDDEKSPSETSEFKWYAVNIGNKTLTNLI